jgi:hypothetical protein
MTQKSITTLISPSQVANILGVKLKTLAQWRSSGLINLPYCKIGSRVMYRASDVDAYISRSMISGFLGDKSDFVLRADQFDDVEEKVS